MTEPYLRELRSLLHVTTQKFEAELRGVRSSRPSVGLVEHILVDYYNQSLPIRELASLSVRPPREIEVTVWDKTAIGAVERAIEAAKIGLSVTAEGNVVRASLPPLTQERREELARLVKKMAETARIQVRHHRDEIIKRVKAAAEEKKLSEDQVFKAKEEIQKAVDQANEKVEGLVANKLQELSE